MGGTQSTVPQVPTTRRARRTQPRVSQHDKALLDVKVQRDRLAEQEQRLAVLLQREADLARALVATPGDDTVRAAARTRAKVVLASRKQHAELLTRICTQRINIEAVALSLEDAASQVDVLAALEKGNAVLRELHDGPLRIDRVIATMDAVSDGIHDVQEVSDVLAAGIDGTQLALLEGLSADDDLLQELERLAGDVPSQDKKQVTDTTVDAVLQTAPSVPDHIPKEHSSSVEEPVAEEREDVVEDREMEPAS